MVTELIKLESILVIVSKLHLFHVLFICRLVAATRILVVTGLIRHNVFSS